MEPVSFVVGVAGLAGLFSTCLDAVERFESYKSFEPESRSLLAQFDTHKVRFQEWGSEVGIKDGKLLPEHNKRLDDPKVGPVIMNLLSSIQDIGNFEDEQGLGSQPTAQDNQSSQESKSIRDQIWPRSHTPRQQENGSKRKKFGWAFKDKNKRMAQVDQFSKLVDNIYHLVPISGKSKQGTDEQEQGLGKEGDGGSEEPLPGM